MAFTANTVTVPAGTSATVSVSLTPPAGVPDHTVFNGYLVFTPSVGQDVYRVPYAGFKGDYQSLPIMTPTTSGFPWLTKQTPTGNFVNQPSGATYTLTGSDFPYILAHFDHQAYRVRMIVQQVSTGALLGRAFYSEYRARNTGPTRSSASGGTDSWKRGWASPLPNGQYRLISPC